MNDYINELTIMKDDNIHTNFKYSSRNIISRRLVSNFNNTLMNIIQSLDFTSILDLGCGEGIILTHLKKILIEKKCVGVDIDAEHIKKAKINAPFCNYVQGSIYDDLRLHEKSFDLVTCLEVLEHLENPEKALEQIQKISSKYIIVSVPREPIWRIMNMARGKYWKYLGNTPGHINHWSTKGFKAQIAKNFNIISIHRPLPWTIILAEQKK